MAAPTKMMRLDIPVSPELKGRVEEEATASGCSFADVVRLALFEYLARRELIRPGSAGGPASEVRGGD